MSGKGVQKYSIGMVLIILLLVCGAMAFAIKIVPMVIPSGGKFEAIMVVHNSTGGLITTNNPLTWGDLIYGALATQNITITNLSGDAVNSLNYSVQGDYTPTWLNVARGYIWITGLASTLNKGNSTIATINFIPYAKSSSSAQINATTPFTFTIVVTGAYA